MTNLYENTGEPSRRENTESKLGRWECVAIKCFAILFLILFLSEKVIKEVGGIRRTWVSEISASLASPLTIPAASAAPSSALQSVDRPKKRVSRPLAPGSSRYGQR